MTDGLAVYQAAARGSPKIALLFCWAHVRRKFLEALGSYPQCRAGPELIGQMYVVERQVPRLAGLSAEAREEALQLRAQLRATQTKPPLEQLWAWAQEQQCLPQSRLRVALDYMRSLWPGLIRFADDPRLPLDNNRCELDLRTVVVEERTTTGASPSEARTQRRSCTPDRNGEAAGTGRAAVSAVGNAPGAGQARHSADAAPNAVEVSRSRSSQGPDLDPARCTQARGRSRPLRLRAGARCHPGRAQLPPRRAPSYVAVAVNGG